MSPFQTGDAAFVRSEDRLQVDVVGAYQRMHVLVELDDVLIGSNPPKSDEAVFAGRSEKYVFLQVSSDNQLGDGVLMA